MSRKTASKIARALISFGFAAVMVRWVIVRSGLDLLEVWELADSRWVSLAFGIYGLGIVLAAYRWKLLLNHVGVMLGYATVLRLAFIGLFFNLFVPGGVGGDLIKMFYLRTEARENFTEAALTVLLDRILGLVGLLVLAVVGLGLNVELMQSGSTQMKAMLYAVGAAGVGTLLGTFVFFLWPYLGAIGKKVGTVVKRFPERVAGILARVGKALGLLREVPAKLTLLLGMAVLGHLCATLGVMALGYGYDAKGLNFQEYLLSTQLANLVGAVPLTPGGVGGRDLAMAILFEASGAPKEVAGALPLMVTAVLISWSIIGGLALLWERKSGVSGEDLDSTQV